MHIVGGHERDIHLARNIQILLHHFFLLFNPVVVNFQVEIVFAENILILADGARGLFDLIVADVIRHLALETARKPYQPFVIFFQHFLVHARLVVKTFQIPDGGKLHQIAVAFFVFGENGEMEGSVFDAVRGFVKAGGRRDISLDADNGLHALLHGLLIKLDGAEHVAVVGEGYGRKAQFAGALEKLGHFASAVKQAVLRMLV